MPLRDGMNPPKPTPAFLDGGGESGAALRAVDWAATPLGPPEDWPAALTTLVGVLLAAPQPMLIAWGPARTAFFNDAYAALLGGAPAPARPFGEVWLADTQQAPSALSAAYGGEAVRLEEVRFPAGIASFAFTPVRGADGAVAGVFCTGSTALAPSRSEALLSAVLDALPVGVLIADAGGRIVRDNAVHRDLWGMAPETTSWEQYGDWVGYWPETGERIKAAEWAMSRALLRGEVVRGELVESERFGTRERRFFLNNAAPVRDASGTILAGVVVELDVTGRLATERALRETEERYRLAARATNDAIWDWDLATDHIQWNEAVRTLFGYAPDEVGPAGAWWKETIHPDDRGRVVAGIHAVIDGAADLWTAEYRFRRADGSYADVYDRGTVLRDACGQAVRMIGAMLDVTERKAAEAALRESAAALETRLNALPQMVWSTLPDGHHDFYNDRWYEFTGVPHRATDGAGWAGIVHPDDRDQSWAAWRHSLATGIPYQVEYRMLHRSGEYRWMLGRALPIRGPDGAITRWMGTSTDIDELKRTADELRRTSALLRLIGDSTPDMIYAKGRDSRLLYANAAIQRILDRPLDRIIGHSDLDWAPDRREAEAIIANDRRVMETGDTFDVDEAFTGPDGRTRYFRSVKSPLRDASGAIIGLVGLTSDMTARRQAEERERLLAREVDHRAKNMLAVVQSLIQLTRADDVAALKQAVSGRIQALARAHTLLAASRWEGVDIARLAEEELAPFAGRDGRRVAARGPAVRLKPDAAQTLALVLHELATNAAKYGALSADGGRLDVEWRLRPDASGSPGGGERLELDWREGGGPAAAPPSRRGFGSTLIRTGVEHQLHGEVAMDWRAEGLACRLSFPVEQPGPAREPGQPGPERADAPPQPEGGPLGLRVLVVEDEVLVAMQIGEILREAGCDVLGPASTIAEAADHLHGAEIDAALLDVNLTGEHSFPVADILSAKRIPFAFCTGYAGATALPDRFRAVPVVAKPFAPDELLAVLRDLRRKAEKAAR
ncbi:PAS domain S-box protein [Azospirillum sp. SYSU D00513]|uniref:PAS domain S-box protein n=1 Tax=Azospirillum sp. SYSU D00513 TaxID=2812561 RepID=UPI001A95FEFE|nr:PAS domain S-box protein [Azospirillum sp. SYSU D00513]